MSAAMVEVFASSDIKAVPVAGYHVVRAEVVVVPGRKDKLGAGTVEGLEKFAFVLFSPSVIVVDITSKIRWVAVDDVAWLGPFNRFGKMNIVELPIFLA